MKPVAFFLSTITARYRASFLPARTAAVVNAVRPSLARCARAGRDTTFP